MCVCLSVVRFHYCFSVLYNAALNRESHAKSFFPNNFYWTRTVTTDTFLELTPVTILITKTLLWKTVMERQFNMSTLHMHVSYGLLHVFS